MPKVTINEDGELVLSENDVRSAEDIPTMFPISIAKRIQLGAYQAEERQFEPRIAASNQAHMATPLDFGHFVWHSGVLLTQFICEATLSCRQMALGFRKLSMH